MCNITDSNPGTKIEDYDSAPRAELVAVEERGKKNGLDKEGGT